MSWSISKDQAAVNARFAALQVTGEIRARCYTFFATSLYTIKRGSEKQGIQKSMGSPEKLFCHEPRHEWRDFLDLDYCLSLELKWVLGVMCGIRGVDKPWNGGVHTNARCSSSEKREPDVRRLRVEPILDCRQNGTYFIQD